MDVLLRGGAAKEIIFTINGEWVILDESTTDETEGSRWNTFKEMPFDNLLLNQNQVDN